MRGWPNTSPRPGGVPPAPAQLFHGAGAGFWRRGAARKRGAACAAPCPWAQVGRGRRRLRVGRLRAVWVGGGAGSTTFCCVAGAAVGHAGAEPRAHGGHGARTAPPRAPLGHGCHMRRVRACWKRWGRACVRAAARRARRGRPGEGAALPGATGTATAAGAAASSCCTCGRTPRAARRGPRAPGARARRGSPRKCGSPRGRKNMEIETQLQLLLRCCYRPGGTT